MNFVSTRPYVDVCVDYALAYSQSELSAAFSQTVNRICQRHEISDFASGKRVIMQTGPAYWETTTLPTNIRDGLWYFFGGRLTTSWSKLPFADYFKDVKDDMVQCYIPFRSFSNESFQDSMRLRVYQDSMNIIAGRKLDGASSKSYSIIQKTLWRLKEVSPPEL